MEQQEQEQKGKKDYSLKRCACCGKAVRRAEYREVCYRKIWVKIYRRKQRQRLRLYSSEGIPQEQLIKQQKEKNGNTDKAQTLKYSCNAC